MTDPFAHGTPVGDHHMWADPGQLDCPDCRCCTVRLCQAARERGTTCNAVAGRAANTHDLSDCACWSRP
jgi:hypothetical protein